MTSFQSLGQDVRGPSKTLETFPAPTSVTEVTFTSHELSSFCPITHQPDFYTLTLFYVPNKLCIESKSLKRYLWSFREETCFAETLAHNMAHDVMNVLHARYCKITLAQQIRGGLQLTASAELGKLL